MKKNSTRNLILLFLTIFGIKAIISFFFTGTYFYSDEACVVQKAIYFAQNFKIETCSFIAEAPAGDPLPFYSIVISPIYLFLKGLDAYHAILLLNSLLIALLTFPLYKIIEKFIESEKINYLIIFVTLFLPQIIIYEKMLMTESIFVVANIWTLYFYMESFNKNKIRNKSLAILFAIFAALMRPFGFIVLFAITINEFITSKSKKFALAVLLPLSIVTLLIAFSMLNGIGGALLNKFMSMTDPTFIREGIKAMKDQVNSFTITTFLIPIILFFTYINKKDSKDLKNIKYFLLAFLFLNFLVSANHMHGYLLENNRTALLTRYINIAIIYFNLFGLIFFFRYRRFKLNTLGTIALITTMGSLFFLEYQAAKHSLNIDLSLFYNTDHFVGANIAQDNGFLAYYFPPIIFVLITLLFLNKRKLLITSLIAIFLIQSGMLYIWERDFGNKQQQDPTFQYFKETEFNILTIESYNRRLVDFTFWRLLTLTKNDTDSIYFNDHRFDPIHPNFNSEKGKTLLGKYDYVISNFNFNLPIETSLPDGTKIYNVKN